MTLQDQATAYDGWKIPDMVGSLNDPWQDPLFSSFDVGGNLSSSSDRDVVVSSSNRSASSKQTFIPEEVPPSLIQETAASSAEVAQAVPRLEDSSVESVFRPTRVIQESHPFPHVNAPALSDDKSILGDLWDSVLDHCTSLGADDGTYEPIPIHILAAGAPVDADDLHHYHETDMTTTTTTSASMPIVSPGQMRFKRTIDEGCLTTTASSYEHLGSTVFATTASTVSSMETAGTCSRRKRRRTAQDYDTSDNDWSHKKQSDSVIGPDSMQMMSIERMIVFLQETCDDKALIQKVQDAVEDCKNRHNKGEFKYMNLPGAIFERLVETVGGTDFWSMYKASQDFDHPRLHEMGIGSVSEAGSVCSSDDLSNNVSQLTTSSAPGLPNLLQVAVGYGFHLARLHLMEGTESNMQDLLVNGTNVVLEMKEEERYLFWKYMLESPMLHQQLQQQQQL